MNPDQRSDEQLMVLSRDDPQAFVPIFDRHFDRIAAYVTRRWGTGEAEDLSSEVFVRAFANRQRYDRKKADVVPWLYGIATNVLRESRREQRRQLGLLARARATALGDRAVDSTGGGGSSPVAIALRGLSEKEREPLLLYALADLDYAQIAEALDVPLGTVKSRVNRARGKLRRRLADPTASPRTITKEGISHG